MYVIVCCMVASALPLVLAVSEVPTSSTCHFPLYLQSGWNGEPEREWHGHLTRNTEDSNKATSYTYIVTFKGAFMKAAVSGGWKMKRPPKPYTRECVREVQAGRFLVLHSESGLKHEKYTCMHFILRSGDVMQVKISRLSNRANDGLCRDENLVLDSWPFINKLNVFNSYEDCPLQGGYNIKVFDKATRTGVCDAFHGETRLESECMEGEGMYFRYRYDLCIPKDIHMSSNQRVYCMATWQDGDNTFSVLRHDRDNHQWCFRYPTGGAREFVAFLFKDVICDTNFFPEMTEDYLQLDMTRDEPRPLSSLCMDDYEACAVKRNPCRHAGSITHLSCARTCGVCGDSRPATCTFDSKYHGKWIDTSRKHKEVVRISDMFVSIQGFRQMQCIKWNEGFYYSDADALEQMLVTTFENGCRPRYQCVHFQKRTPSILRYKLSQSQIWPFMDTAGDIVDCRSFPYRDDDYPLFDRYRSRHFKTLISLQERIYVDCRLEGTKEFMAEFTDGSRCNGSLSSDNLSSENKMHLTLYRCPRQPHDQEFACLDSWQNGYYGDHLIVTEAMGVSSELGCWLFPSTTRDTFHLLPAAHCNGGITDKVLNGDLKPEATFKIHPPPILVGHSLRDAEADGSPESGGDLNHSYGGDDFSEVDIEVLAGPEETQKRKDQAYSAQSSQATSQHSHIAIIIVLVMSALCGRS